MSDSDDEPLALSEHALSALQAFYSERDAHVQKLEKLREVVEKDPEAIAEGSENEGDKVLSIDAFTENWNESQFWYADETASLYARQLLDGMGEDDVIAVVSVPSVFMALKNLLTSREFKGPKPKVYFLEYDQRFAVFPEFVSYDLNQPFKLPNHLRGGVDRMILDPPFLSQSCQTKMAMTLRWLARTHETRSPPSSSSSSTGGAPASSDSGKSVSLHSQAKWGPRVIISTGERMETLIHKLYRPLGVLTTTFVPVHKNGLQNEFYCYANFECEHWKWKGGPGRAQVV
ncbi:putative N6-adenine methyltransferase-domain-containing protein [Xylariaceae sp. FL0016]|nr:putative N6-adenine methyltransferase-domain-containing protein [Xylariaceae sp. FL0016]